MPILLEPKEGVPFSLKSDQDKPDDHRPTFLIRGASLREANELSALIDASSAGDGIELIKRMNVALANVVSGWRNMRTSDPRLLKTFGVTPNEDGSPVDLPFDPERVSDVLDFAESQEVCAASLKGVFGIREAKN